VGDGPLRAELARQWPQAIVAGERRGEDLAAHYASADLFLFPSLTETFGNVTVEAMASALPVVAFDRAGAAQLIRSGAEGVRVPVDDRAAFVQAACALAADAPRRQAMGRAARLRACTQDWDEVIARFEQVILQTLPVPASPPHVPWAVASAP
jgi:glycosyltransferase involved in cell wall biosynthesis